MLQRIVKDGYFPDRLDAYASAVRKLGNVGVHSFGEKVTVADVYQSLAQLIPILEWYFEVERPEALGRPAPQVVTALHDLMASQPAPVEAPIFAGNNPSKTKHTAAALKIGTGFILLAGLVLGGIAIVQHFKNGNDVTSPTADLNGKATSRPLPNGKTEPLDKSVDKVPSNVEKVTITDIFSRYADAVLAVVIDGSEGRIIQATAFGVKPKGVLATSGNVAFHASQALQAGRKVSVFSRGGKKKYAVISATPHRDYDDKPLYKMADRAPDVGILTINLPAGELLPNVVELATEDELRKLSPGAQLCSIAYQGWSDQAVPSKIEPHFGQGTLTRLVTLKGEFGDFSDQYLLQFGMASSAGASGSPVFNYEGKVVGIFSSINLTTQIGNGMRIDLLRELLK